MYLRLDDIMADAPLHLDEGMVKWIKEAREKFFRPGAEAAPPGPGPPGGMKRQRTVPPREGREPAKSSSSTSTSARVPWLKPVLILFISQWPLP